VVADGKVIVGSDDGRLYMVSLADGKELWHYEIGQPVQSSPAVVDGHIVVGAADGSVYCFGDQKESRRNRTAEGQSRSGRESARSRRRVTSAGVDEDYRSSVFRSAPDFGAKVQPRRLRHAVAQSGRRPVALRHSRLGILTRFGPIAASSPA
jgi:hypothetical protein